MKRIMLNAAFGAVLFAAVAFWSAGCSSDTSVSSSEKEATGETPSPYNLPGAVGGYFRDCFWVELREGFTIENLKSLDQESGLPLSSAVYKVSGGVYNIQLRPRATGEYDPDDVVARLRSLAPVEGAYKIAVVSLPEGEHFVPATD